ncbi:unnamed protein product [Haemonchus placei]|uniref:Protein shifted n=1 Tax=Haemonchus placei TaxID=6290 RepID=A0A0N4X8K5_HAEPC|nr:unnamed protein product [Haemonchus placei]
MQALPFAFLLFISLSIVETKRSSSEKEDEQEIVPIWSGGTTPVYEDKGSIKEDNNGHEIRPMEPDKDDESEKERYGNEIQPMNPNLSGTTPGYTGNKCEKERNGNEIRLMNPSSTTPGYMRKGSTPGIIINEVYPTWPTVNTPGYMEKGSTRKKCVYKTTTTTTWSTITTPGYDESGSTRGNAPDEKPPTKPPARTHGNEEKGSGRGNNAGYKPPTGPSVSYSVWPGYGGRGLTHGKTRLGLGGFQGNQLSLGRSPSFQHLSSAIKQ